VEIGNSPGLRLNPATFLAIFHAMVAPVGLSVLTTLLLSFGPSAVLSPLAALYCGPSLHSHFLLAVSAPGPCSFPRRPSLSLSSLFVRRCPPWILYGGMPRSPYYSQLSCFFFAAFFGEPFSPLLPHNLVTVVFGPPNRVSLSPQMVPPLSCGLAFSLIIIPDCFRWASHQPFFDHR